MNLSTNSSVSSLPVDRFLSLLTRLCSGVSMVGSASMGRCPDLASVNIIIWSGGGLLWALHDVGTVQS